MDDKELEKEETEEKETIDIDGMELTYEEVCEYSDFIASLYK